MEEQGDLRSGGDVTEGSAGLPPRRPVARPTAPCVPAPWRQRAAYRGMQVSCGGQGTAWALPGREWGPGPREIPGKIPSPGPRGSSGLPRLLPWGLVAPARPRLLARNHPAAARTKAISWGPPPCSSIRKGVPLYGWKNRGEPPRRWLLSEPRLVSFGPRRGAAHAQAGPPNTSAPPGKGPHP